MKNTFLILFVVSIITLGCGEQKGEANQPKATSEKPETQIQLDASELYHAEVTQEMTLVEVSKVNSLSETYLKQKLGIPQYIKHPYTVLQLSRNYDFTVDDLKRIIEKFKNKKALEIKKTLARNKENNK